MANGSGHLTELTANELHQKRVHIRQAQAAANTASSTSTVTITPNAPAELLLADAANTEVRKLFPKVRGRPSGADRRRA
jgi:hypothetical protein